jgi:PAS domain-containing protein
MPRPIAPELAAALAAADLLGLTAVVLDGASRVLASTSTPCSGAAPADLDTLPLDPPGRRLLQAALDRGQPGPTEPLAAGGRWLQAELSWPAGPGPALALLRDIGALRRGEQQMRRERDKLCRLADSAPVLMAYCEDDGLRCSYANRAFVQ